MNPRAMLPLERLTIHQFRGLRDVELAGLGRFNVLVGRNNSGKTTVLEAVATYACPLYTSEWIEVVERRDVTQSQASMLKGLRWLFPQHDKREGRAPQPFQSTTRVSGTGKFPVRESIAQFEEIRGFSEEAQKPNSDGLTSFPRKGGIRRGAQLELRAVIEEKLELREESGKTLLWEQGLVTIRSFGPKLPVTTITPFSHRVQQIEVEAFSDAIFADFKPTVLELVRIFDPQIKDFEVLKRSRAEPAVYVRHERFGRAPLSTFGDGMRRVLLMGVSLAMVRGGILLVDEIESAIHTEALDATFRWLQRACRQFDVQLFTTTHSLEAVDALLAASGDMDDLVVYRLERKDDSTRVKRFSRERLRILREELGQEIRA